MVFFFCWFLATSVPAHPAASRCGAEQCTVSFVDEFLFFDSRVKKKKKKTTTKLPDGLADTHHRYYYRCRRDSTTVSYGDGSEDSQIYQPPEQRSAVFTNILHYAELTRVVILSCLQNITIGLRVMAHKLRSTFHVGSSTTAKIYLQNLFLSTLSSPHMRVSGCLLVFIFAPTLTS